MRKKRKKKRACAHRPPRQFCHRRLVAEWLEEHLGVVIPELPHHYNPDQLNLFD